ncbi:MAG: CBS domain-containing protein [Candidatus Micrarchaeota archaeon]|nr:CBS domain-containing protein [Candidatus Micrarchaeota archaeon]
MEDLGQIRKLRRRLGITQQQLARMSGTSQSLIAKIESGRVDASYSKVMAIIGALEKAQMRNEKKAGEIMHRGVETASASETLHSAAAKMRRLGISQLPVEQNGKLVGSICEEQIVGLYSSNPRKMSSLRVSEVMGDCLPAASPSTPLPAVVSLLRYHPAVLVMEKGRLAGIITKADLLKTI